MWYDKYAPVTTYEGYDIKSLEFNQKVRHHHQRMWLYRIRSCLICCNNEHTELYVDISVTLSDMFTYFRGYVPSDIVAGIALHAIHADSKVHAS